MSNPQKIHDSDPNENTSWLITYGDIVTLLLIFFVLMFSASKVTQDKFDKVAKSINESLNRPVQQSEVVKENPLSQVEKMINRLIVGQNLEGRMSTELQADAIMLELSSNSFFASGSALVKPAMQQTLFGLSQIIAALPITEYRVEIEGHTDDVPINSSRFPSNWELSAMRAINVLHLFERAGLEPAMMSASAFADTRPKVANIGTDGVGIPENRATNRRIVVFIRQLE